MTEALYVPARACQERINAINERIGELTTARQLYEDLLAEAVSVNGTEEARPYGASPAAAMESLVREHTEAEPDIDPELAEADEEWSGMSEYQQGKLLEIARGGTATMHHKSRTALGALGYIDCGIDDRCELTKKAWALLERIGWTR